MTSKSDFDQWDINLAKMRKYQGTDKICFWVYRREAQEAIIASTPADLLKKRAKFFNDTDMLAHELGFTSDVKFLHYLVDHLDNPKAINQLIMKRYHGEIL